MNNFIPRSELQFATPAESQAYIMRAAAYVNHLGTHRSSRYAAVMVLAEWLAYQDDKIISRQQENK